MLSNREYKESRGGFPVVLVDYGQGHNTREDDSRAAMWTEVAGNSYLSLYTLHCWKMAIVEADFGKRAIQEKYSIVVAANAQTVQRIGPNILPSGFTIAIYVHFRTPLVKDSSVDMPVARTTSTVANGRGGIKGEHTSHAVNCLSMCGVPV